MFGGQTGLQERAVSCAGGPDCCKCFDRNKGKDKSDIRPVCSPAMTLQYSSEEALQISEQYSIANFSSAWHLVGWFGVFWGEGGC